jgi:hypothetical protein
MQIDKLHFAHRRYGFSRLPERLKPPSSFHGISAITILKKS